MKSIFDKKLSSKLSEKVSSKLTLKGICKKFETVNYEQDNSAVYGWNTFQRELKQFLKRKEQELLGEIERFTKLYMESHRDNQDLEQEIYKLKQQLKQIEEGSLIPEIFIDDLNELSRLREQKKKIEELITNIKLIKDSTCNCINFEKASVSCHAQILYEKIMDKLKSLLEVDK